MARWYWYRSYALVIKSRIRLPGRATRPAGVCDVELRRRRLPDSVRRVVPLDQLPQHIRHADGTDQLEWPGGSACLITEEGRRIHCDVPTPPDDALFQTFFLGQALSFSLLKRGLEPLHATAVVVKDGAVAFLGDSLQGKSTLAAAFLYAGDRLLCDDVLTLTSRVGGGYLAHPGMPRIKLFPRIAARFLTQPTAPHPNTPKRVIYLPPERTQDTPVPLRAIIALMPIQPARLGTQTLLRRLRPTRGCLALIKNTYNTVVDDPARLTQQFYWATRVAREVPLYTLTYPKRLNALARVRRAILAALAG